MKVIYDNGREYSADEVAFGMGRYVVHDGETVVDVDNDGLVLLELLILLLPPKRD